MLNKTLQSSALSAHDKISDMAFVRVSDLTNLTSLVIALVQEVKSLREYVAPSKPLSNKEVKDLLNIQDRLLKKYRDDGLLGYSQVGDKYWYSQTDIDNFLTTCRVEPIYTAAWHPTVLKSSSLGRWFAGYT